MAGAIFSRNEMAVKDYIDSCWCGGCEAGRGAPGAGVRQGRGYAWQSMGGRCILPESSAGPRIAPCTRAKCHAPADHRPVNNIVDILLHFMEIGNHLDVILYYCAVIHIFLLTLHNIIICLIELIIVLSTLKRRYVSLILCYDIEIIITIEESRPSRQILFMDFDIKYYFCCLKKPGFWGNRGLKIFTRRNNYTLSIRCFESNVLTCN